MGIYASIQCDHCGKEWRWPHIGKTHVIRWAREDGWSIGKTIKCPDCKKKKTANAAV